MILADVNVLVAAIHERALDHEAMAEWLDAAARDIEELGISVAVVTGAVRILTHPSVFEPPATTGQALDAIADLLAHDGVRLVESGPGYLDILDRLCRATGVRGNDVADAGHAATAIAHGATFVTKDRGFARFPGLRWRRPD